MRSRFPWRDTSEDIAENARPQWETPAGAQEKADKAEQAAKDYSDERLAEHVGTGGSAHSLAVPDAEAGFISGVDQAKLNGIQAGAEINQNAYSVINNIPAGQKEDHLTITAGTGITVTPDPANKEIRITSSGTAIPGKHGTEHLSNGADPIPEATGTISGLMSAADKVALDTVVEDVESLAGAGRTTETVKGNADAIADVTAQLAEYVQVEDYGAVGDGSTDDSIAIKNAVISSRYKTLKFKSNRTYVVKQLNVIELLGDIKIDGRGCTILVPSDAPLVDVVGYEGVYKNAVFQCGMGKQSNIEIKGIHFDFRKEKVSGLFLGDVNNPMGDGIRKNIKVHNCTATGNGFDATFFGVSHGSEIFVEENSVKHISGLWHGSENSGLFRNNTCEHIGVSGDLNTWLNYAAIRLTGARNMDIFSNIIRYSGGTALSVSSASSSSDSVTIKDNRIYAAGLCGIGVGNKPGGGNIKNINIEGNYIYGYCCAPDGDLHPGIEAGSSAENGIVQDFYILNNHIDFLAPYETFDSVNYTVLNSKNNKKSAHVLGSGMIAINCSHVAANNARGFSIKGNRIKYNKEVSIRVAYVQDVSIVENHIYQSGWERDATTKNPLYNSGNNGIRIAFSCDIMVRGNTLIEIANGLSTASQGTIPIRLEACTNFIVSENSYSTLNSGHNKAFLTASGGANATEYFKLFGHTASLFKGAIVNNYMLNADTSYFDALEAFNFNLDIFLISPTRLDIDRVRPDRGFDGHLHVKGSDVVTTSAPSEVGKISVWVDGARRYIPIYSP
ncbi:hypothetical protein NYE70_23630 [Paenibacillus sp. FSL R5-0407]|uniref:right-handed parallel beta-helix repeat-containing protein n=1 Tax=Paenibacillus sp. FSL R5-0407 TaxID=2975320 RepID=UPI0030FB72B4